MAKKFIKMKQLRFLFICIWSCYTPLDSTASPHTHSIFSNKNNIALENVGKHKKITKSVAKLIEPHLKDWLQFYHLNLLDFYLTRDEIQNIAINRILTNDSVFGSDDEDTEQGIHARKFESSRDDVYIPQLYDYSPSKLKYLNLLETSGVYRDNGKFYYDGGGDCQEIYLTDRHNKTTKLVIWAGSTSFVEAIFWLDENTFIAVGNKDLNIHYLQIFSYYKEVGYYEYKRKVDLSGMNYFLKNLKTRGVIIL